jgi:hypothetical protein
MRFKMRSTFCTIIFSLCASLILSGCGRPATSSPGWPTSGNKSGDGKPAEKSSSSTAGAPADSSAKKKQPAVDGGNKAVADKDKAADSDPPAKQSEPPANKTDPAKQTVKPTDDASEADSTTEAEVAKAAAPTGLMNIGSRKQLFVDDYLLESVRNTTRVMNPAEKVDGNPVLRPDKPWEGSDVYVSAVIFEEEEQLFRMWYTAGKLICLAASKDGVHWEKPVLGLVEYEGSKENNILPPDQFKTYFFKDLHEKDPAKRYKGLERRGSMSTTMQFELYYSPDGFQWTPYAKNPVIDTGPRKGRWGPTVFMGWDPIRKVYAVHNENSLHRWSPAGRRLIGRAESRDMIHWSESETIIVPDDQDPPDMDFYCMPTIAYEDHYVGLLWTFRTIRTTIVPQIVFSRDGIHYNRSYREPYIARGAKGTFDAAVVYPIDPIVHGDRILYYYTGGNYRDGTTLRAVGDKAMFAVGLATTPRDRFVSFEGARFSDEAGVKPYSQVVTRSFTFSGSQLHLNLQANLYTGAGVSGPCEMRVEILDTTHHVISGFGFQDCDPLNDGGLDRVVSWKGRRDLSKLTGRPIKLRFSFRNASLYAFQFK